MNRPPQSLGYEQRWKETQTLCDITEHFGNTSVIFCRGFVVYGTHARSILLGFIQFNHAVTQIDLVSNNCQHNVLPNYFMELFNPGSHSLPRVGISYVINQDGTCTLARRKTSCTVRITIVEHSHCVKTLLPSSILRKVRIWWRLRRSGIRLLAWCKALSAVSTQVSGEQLGQLNLPKSPIPHVYCLEVRSSLFRNLLVPWSSVLG